MRTVREFKTYFNEQFSPQCISELKSSALQEFWQKLNKLGWEKKTKEPNECDDVDATAFLTEHEWEELNAEFIKIKSESLNE